MKLTQFRKQSGSQAGRRLSAVRSAGSIHGNTKRKRNKTKGMALVEFALVAFVLFIVIFGIVEMERLLLVYTTLANAARGGVRYAIVHGSDRTGSGVNGPSSAGSTSNIQNTVKALAGAGALNTASLVVTVNYLDGTNTPGSRVSVQAGYPYDPFTAVPLGVNLSSVSEGVITF
jgi:Flp pilus assembly protein TadG